jgi:hypothetical protein
MTVADSRSFIYRIDAQNRIVFLSQEWLDFAKENQMAEELTAENLLGKDLQQFIDGWETAHLYELIYQRVRTDAREIRFPFRCDSPTMDRFMEMRISPQEKDDIEFDARVIRLESHPLISLLDPSAPHSSIIVVICSWCKRIRIDGNWAEIQDAVGKHEFFGALPPRLTHGICPDCSTDIHRRLRASEQKNG